MIDARLLIGIVMIGVLMLSLKVLMEWQLYKFNKKCQFKIRHLQIKERYELLKRLTR